MDHIEALGASIHQQTLAKRRQETMTTPHDLTTALAELADYVAALSTFVQTPKHPRAARKLGLITHDAHALAKALRAGRASEGATDSDALAMAELQKQLTEATAKKEQAVTDQSWGDAAEWRQREIDLQKQIRALCTPTSPPAGALHEDEVLILYGNPSATPPQGILHVKAAAVPLKPGAPDEDVAFVRRYLELVYTNDMRAIDAFERIAARLAHVERELRQCDHDKVSLRKRLAGGRPVWVDAKGAVWFSEPSVGCHPDRRPIRTARIVMEDTSA